jgi:hypothetical protein
MCDYCAIVKGQERSLVEIVRVCAAADDYDNYVAWRVDLELVRLKLKEVIALCKYSRKQKALKTRQRG